MPFLQQDDINIYYKVEGEGTPIILIPPPLLTSDVFYYQQQFLSQSFQVITFDPRGHGKSDKSRKKLTFQQLIDDVKALLNYLEVDQAYIGGYSTGGSIAIDALIKEPKRFLGGIIISSAPEYTDFRNSSLLQIATNLIGLTGLHIVALGVTSSNSDSLSTFKNLFRHAIRGNKKNVKEYYEATQKFNCNSELTRIYHPILLIYGEKDPLFRKYGKTLQDHLDNVTTHVIKGVSHQIPTKAGNTLNKMIQEWISLH